MKAKAIFNEDMTVTIKVNGKYWIFNSVSKAVNFCDDYGIDAKIITNK